MHGGHVGMGGGQSGNSWHGGGSSMRPRQSSLETPASSSPRMPLSPLGAACGGRPYDGNKRKEGPHSPTYDPPPQHRHYNPNHSNSSNSSNSSNGGGGGGHNAHSNRRMNYSDICSRRSSCSNGGGGAGGGSYNTYCKPGAGNGEVGSSSSSSSSSGGHRSSRGDDNSYSFRADNRGSGGRNEYGGHGAHGGVGGGQSGHNGGY
jgi:hypothetical protein